MAQLEVQFQVTTHDSGLKTYVGEMRHEGLGKKRVIRDTSENPDFVRVLMLLQWNDWEAKYEALEQGKFDLESRFPEYSVDDDQCSQKADVLTRNIQNEQRLIETILNSSLVVSHAVDWDEIKERLPSFSETAPKFPALPKEPIAPSLPIRPVRESSEYSPKLFVIDKLFESRRVNKIAQAQERYDHAIEQWQLVFDKINIAHSAEQNSHGLVVARLKSIHDEKIKEWEFRRAEFEAQQQSREAAIDAKKAAYLARVPSTIVDYCALVLSQSNYPTFFPHEFELDYDASSGQVIVDYLLPAPDNLPKLKGVKWVRARKMYEEQKLSDAFRTNLFDGLVYQTVLRTAHELIEADAAGAINSVVVNGIVNSIDRGTGKELSACIVSLRVEAAELEGINLDQVDPKTCFKTLKGVGSSRLHGLSPIPPIMSISRADSRFVAAYEVADELHEGVNLASMGWEDFEQLIRELFEKEFAATGGEVRVTQASRDGGVDAIAFDPDPIRGGKIVIQAKRYTNTVGVSAVRDLYGTVMNEGANKGVLVTTSDYGPDSYNFAKGKPLVLLNGSNLLHMLQKHGHRAKIDIREAKELANRQDPSKVLRASSP